MSLRRAFLLATCSFSLLITGVPLGFTVSALENGQGVSCHNVSAKIAAVKVSENCSSPVAFCSIGTITGGGLVNGTFAGSVLGFGPSAGPPGLIPPSTLSFVAVHTIQNSRGTLTLLGTGVFDTARGEFAEADPVTSGTGAFEGATGTLFLTGTSRDGGNSVSGEVTGTICVARMRGNERD